MNALAQGEVCIEGEGDIVVARRTVRELATECGFSSADITRIVTAASELARNVFQYARKGTLVWLKIEEPGRVGIELRFEDSGPGIADISLALQEGYTTGKGLGLGLPGARRLMDEMDIQSILNQGTTITVRKWRTI